MNLDIQRPRAPSVAERKKRERTQDEAVPERIEVEFIKQEHRTFRVLRNLWRYGFSKKDEDRTRRSAALEALFWRIVSPGTVGMIALGAGGIIGIVLAWQANTLLREQNKKIEIQNALVQTQNALVEAQRRSALIFELTSIMEAIEREKSKDDDDEYKPSELVSARIIALSRSLLPYQFIDTTGELTQKQLSPERGQLLITIVAAGIPINAAMLFSDAYLQGSDFRHTNLSRANLRGADLRSAQLRGADVSGIDLSNADLRDADLSTTKQLGEFGRLLDADGQRMLDSDGQSMITESTARFENANITGANLSRADLPDVDFSNANLTDTSLEGAKMIGAQLEGANLTRSNLRDADLTDADLTDADLTDADLTDADLTDADLTDADLTDADLTDANLKGADLRGAKLQGAELEGVDVRGANIYMADMNEEEREKLRSGGAVELHPEEWHPKKNE